MVNYTRIVQKKGSAYLEPGEQVLAGLLCKPKGTVSKAFVSKALGGVSDLVGAAAGTIAQIVAGVAGEAIQQLMEGAEAGESEMSATFPRTDEVIISATDRRLLVFYQTFGLMSPNLKLCVAYPPDSITTIDIRGGVAMRKLTIIFSDLSAAKMEIPRGQGDVKALADALNARLNPLHRAPHG